MNIVIHGASGNMGRMLRSMIDASESHTVAAAAAIDFPENCTHPEYRNLDDYTGECDCLIDFSHHTAVGTVLDYAVKRNIPLVLATTGHTPEELELVKKAAEKTAVFQSANMSVGVALLINLARQTAKLFPDADIEIVESHHNMKYDVPSGTALMLAKGIKEARPEAEFVIGRHENGRRRKEEIGIHSLRIGGVVGMHEVHVSTGAQTITLRHEAHSRALFAEGAIAAAEFIAGKAPGVYGMTEMLAE